DRIVRGENISQAYHFVTSGNAELGFVAASQVIRPGKQFQGSLWAVPDSLYSPIEQQVVLLRDVEAARDFLEFVKSEEAVQIIHDFGYDTP
ncbi:MAG TPA: molybdate ABC transporter substrate-binding protein, partial [Rhodothermia bacterium]|nr:molybdate ABC transporter substrate-binding protein [Rhodothermia bacterium]